MTQETQTRRGPEPPDIAERGGMKNGQPQRSDERLFMQLLVYGGCRDSQALSTALSTAGIEGALYETPTIRMHRRTLLPKDPNSFSIRSGPC